MMSGMGDFNGKKVLLLGLVVEEVEMLLKEPLSVAISVAGSEVDLPQVHEIRIMVGQDERAFMEFLQGNIDEHTEIRNLPESLKN